MRSPIVAMLWEQWRLTRVEAGQRMALGLVVGAFAMTLFESSGATAAFWMLVLVHSMIWFSIAKLNGGRFSDGYKPGFPLYLLFTRPVSTPVIVGVAMAYDAATCVAMYLVSAALLGLAFGQPLPLFSMIVCLVSYHFAYACCQWATRSRTVQWVGSTIFSVPMFLMLHRRVETPLRVELSLLDNAVFAAIGLVAVGLTIAGVARQRRGDAVAREPRPKAATGLHADWLISLFRIRCPTSSATKAQLWFELKSSGLPMMTIGLGLALVIYLLTLLGASFRAVHLVSVPLALISSLVALFAFGSNAFGIRRKQGRTYGSPFELTQPYGTAHMAGIKLLVRTSCVLIALGAILCASGALALGWLEWQMSISKEAVENLGRLREKVAGEFVGLPGYAFAALAVVGSIATAGVIAWQAAREALRARYRRQLLVAGSALYGCSVAIVLLAIAQSQELVPDSAVRTAFGAAYWIFGVAIVLATTYLLWNGFAERVITIRFACAAAFIAAAFPAAWIVGMPAPSLSQALWLSALILMVLVLAPWSLGRVRHA